MGWIPEWVKRISPLRWPRRIFDSMMEPHDGDSRDALFIFVLGAIAFMAAMFVMAVVAQWYGGTLGAFGDFFGGVLNPIFSFLTFVGLLITIVMQQKEIRDAKAAAEKQGFETLFFQMVTIHNSIVNAMDLRTAHNPQEMNSAKEYHGRDCFPRFYEHLKQEIKKSKDKNDLRPIEEGYKAFWARDRKDLGHYFRYLYNMIRIVDESGADTRQYMKLLRAQLSDYELIILFYNGLNEKGARFKPYIEKYAIFDNLPRELLIDQEDLQLYDGSATFDTIAARKEKVRKFLETWRSQHITAESLGPEGFFDALRQIESDAEEAGISRRELDDECGGSLTRWLTRAVRDLTGQ